MEYNKSHNLNVLKKIPSWILPSSYFIIAIMTVLALFVLSIIPYWVQVPETIFVHFPTSIASDRPPLFGEIILSKNNGTVKVGNAVDVTIQDDRQTYTYRQAYVDTIYYNPKISRYVVNVKIPHISSSGITVISTYTIKGRAEITIEKTTLLRHLIKIVRQTLP